MFAEMKDPVREKIDALRAHPHDRPAHFYPTIKAAVRAFNALDA